LGMTFNQQIRPSFSFSGLLAGSNYNCHGWGLCCYPDNGKSAMLFKEHVNGEYSQLAEFLLDYRGLKSKTFIGHIRRASKGRLCHDNTHPFTRYFGGREWVFCHNGTLQTPNKLKRLSFKPIGGTDSERSFCFLMSKLRKLKIRPVQQGMYFGYTDNNLFELYDILSTINTQGDGSFNTIFCDSEFLFCYRDMIGARKLYYLERKYPFSTTELRDSDLLIDLNFQKGWTERGFVIASECLSSEDWVSFEPGQLLVFRNGTKVADIRSTG